MSPPLSLPVPPNLAALLAEVENLSRQVAADAEQRLQPYQSRYYPADFSPDARNLASYLALRSNDLRPLQGRLVEAGLSSLGRGESHIQTNLNRIIGIFSRALGIDAPMDFPDDGPAGDEFIDFLQPQVCYFGPNYFRHDLILSDISLLEIVLPLLTSIMPRSIIRLNASSFKISS